MQQSSKITLAFKAYEVEDFAAAQEFYHSRGWSDGATYPWCRRLYEASWVCEPRIKECLPSEANMRQLTVRVWRLRREVYHDCI
jgi:hypothetical protein